MSLELLDAYNTLLSFFFSKNSISLTFAYFIFAFETETTKTFGCNAFVHLLWLVVIAHSNTNRINCEDFIGSNDQLQPPTFCSVNNRTEFLSGNDNLMWLTRLPLPQNYDFNGLDSVYT